MTQSIVCDHCRRVVPVADLVTNQHELDEDDQPDRLCPFCLYECSCEVTVFGGLECIATTGPLVQMVFNF